MRKLTTEEWVTKATAKHGGRYSYKRSEYKGGKEYITITCPVHGDVSVIAANHANSGAKCPKCTNVYRRTTEEFIRDSKLIHGATYNYSKTVYKNNQTKVVIICDEHGEFMQTPQGHLSGHGCKKCADLLTTAALTTSFLDFKDRASIVHHNKYGYTAENYINLRSKITIDCPVHGNFKQVASNHVHLRQGCPECSQLENTIRKTSTTMEFIKKAAMVHGNKYSYESVTYVNNRTEVMINCNTHGKFLQTPHSHLNGYGCTSCATYGFDNNKPGLLYILKLKDSDVYKVGITNYTVKRRYPAADLKKVQVVYERQYEDGLSAFIEEQRILNMFKNYKYTGAPLLSSGNTELLTKETPWSSYFTTSM